MNDSELLTWLTLFHAEGFPSRLLHELIVQRFPGVVSSLLDNQSAELSDVAAAQVSAALQSESAKRAAEAALQWGSRQDNAIIALTSAHYPPLLREISDPPPFLFVRGNPDVLSIPQVAIVGSRRSSVDGRDITAVFAAEIVGKGISVCSGLATGIDTAAHKAALACGGLTVSIMGTGVDVIYPRNNALLASRIQENGALVSEFPLGYPPLPGNFPRRNRIISGLSLGVLVVEAALQSGSLVTARMAMEQSREVFAVPGSIRNPLSRGCHKLIKEGATLVESPEELWSHLESLLGVATMLRAASAESDSDSANAQVRAGALTDRHQRIVTAMGYDPVTFEILASRMQIATSELQTELIFLELAGMIKVDSGRYSLCQEARLQGN